MYLHPKLPLIISFRWLKKLTIVLAVVSLITCSKTDDEDVISIDPAIPAAIVGNYIGDCFIYKYSHTGQIGGLMEEHDTLYNSKISVTEIFPITNYYHRVTAEGDCLPLTEFVVDNKEFLKDSTMMYDSPYHDILELIWVKSDSVVILRYKDRENTGFNYITYDGVFSLE